MINAQEIKKIVRAEYAQAAKKMGGGCCGQPVPLDAACGATAIGYTPKDIKAAPGCAGSSLGCGNPVAFASLKEGETVLDLGSGAGFDCFIAAGKVGPNGRVIGVDMTPEMIDRARGNAEKGKYQNVEFRLGEIENLPAADRTADAVISNCVINLSADKRRVFQEAWRVLKPGGRLMVSDIVLLKELPARIRNSKKTYVSCVAGALLKDEYVKLIKETGFQDVQILQETGFAKVLYQVNTQAEAIVKEVGLIPKEARKAAESIVSVSVHALKPTATVR
jgi:ubiquinone/menaquinone biosynthesis C-methylase UbiE